MFSYLKGIFTIRNQVAPNIINHLYTLSMFIIIGYGILVTAVLISEGFGLIGVLSGLIALVFMPLIARVFFELLQVPFKILDQLERNSNNKRK